MKPVIILTGVPDNLTRNQSIPGLTPQQKEAITSNTHHIVFKTSRRAGGAHGTLWREIVRRGYCYLPKVPPAEIVRRLEKEFPELGGTRIGDESPSVRKAI